MTPIYQPSPLEEAYSFYLAQQVFGIAPNNPVHISGRDAVPFLTQSGIDRGILRTIWTAADPACIGTLTSLSQFHLLLRLVAMAQVGMLNPQHPVDTMKMMVQQCASQQLPLPSFSSIAVPPQDQLMNTYGNFTNYHNNIQTSQQTITMGSSFGGTMDVHNTLHGNGDTNNLNTTQPPTPTTSRFGVPSESQGSSYGLPQQSNLSFEATQVSSGSITDAFSDLGPTINAPLPALGEAPVSDSSNQTTSGTFDGNFSVGNNNGEMVVGAKDASASNAPLEGVGHVAAPLHPAPSNDDDDDFGDFEGVSGVPTPATSFGMPETVNSSGVSSQTSQAQIPLSDAFGALVDVQDAPLPTLDQVSNFVQPEFGQQNEDDEDEDDFGGFETAPAHSMALSDAEPAPSTFDGMAGAQGDLRPDTLGGFESHGVSEGQDQSSSMEQTTATPPVDPSVSMVSSIDRTASISDAFGSLEVPDTPLPSLAQFSTAVSDTDQAPGEEEEDDFGGFEGVTSEANIVEDSAPHIDAAPSVETSILPGDSNDRATSISNAFWSLESPDAPLPSLAQFSTVVSDTDQAPGEEEDDFGGFEGATSDANIVEEGSPDTDAAPPVETSILPGDSIDRATFVSDAFGSLEVPDAPLPSLAQFSTAVSDTDQAPGEEEEDDFGGFEGVTSEANIVEDSAPHIDAAPSVETSILPGDSNDRATSISNAFWSLESPDAPLPSLAQFSTVVSDTDQAPGEEEDDFGGFEGATSDANIVEEGSPDIAIVVAKEDPFTLISDHPDNDLPSEKNTEAFTSDQLCAVADDKDGDMASFGDFGGVPSAEVMTPPNSGEQEEESKKDKTSDDPFSAFNSVAPLQDAPLPILPSVSSEGVDQKPSLAAGDDDDEFGAFGEAPSTNQAIDVVSGDSQTEDEFGDFGGATGSGDFGSFEEPVMNEADGVDPFGNFGRVDESLEVSQGFGEFEGLASPISESLGIDHSQPGNEDGDLFGDFEGSAKEMEVKTGFKNAEGDTYTNPGDSSVTPANQAADILGGYGEASDNNTDFFTSEDISSKNAEEPATKSSLQSNEETDTFGAFGEATSTTKSNADFGIFESAPDNSMNLKPLPSQTTSQEADLFGDFGGATTSTEPIADFGSFEGAKSDNAGGLGTTTMDGEEDFGDFGGASNTAGSNADQDSSSNLGTFGEFDSMQVDTKTQPGDDDNSFGDFDNANTPVSPALDDSAGGDADNFGDFGAATVVQLPDVSQDDFGDFAGIQQSAANSPGPATHDTTPNDDDFGDFSAFENAPPESEPTELEQGGAHVESQDNFEDFGDFGSAEYISPDEPPIAEQDDDFGDFGTFEEAPTEPGQGASQKVEATESDDWGDFEQVAPSKSKAQILRDQVHALSLQLPEALLRKTGTSGEHVDLGECFEVNIGTNSLNDDCQKRADRALLLLQLLTKGHSKLGSAYWDQCLSVIKDELELGKSIVSEATRLPQKDHEAIYQSMQTFLAGLTEYIRVTRSIVATIGDLLMLDASALLTIDTLASTWCSLSILEKALHIEDLWKGIQKEVASFFPGLLGGVDSLEDVRTEVHDALSSDEVCALTLQPLSEKAQSTTKATVTWHGKRFMACSANFLANRCPFYVVSN